MKQLKYLASAFLLCSSSLSFAQKAKSERVRMQKEYVEEIEQLASHPKVKKAFKTIVELEPTTQKEHILLTEIPAPPFKETARGIKYAEILKEIGADSVWTDPVGNVLALRKGTQRKRTIALDAHLDTVFPEGTDVKVRFDGDTLKAPGIADDTRGLAVVLAVLKSMNQAKIKTKDDVLIVATVGEEGLGDLRGVKHLFGKEGVKIDSHIAVDGGGIGGIVNATTGSLRYKITYKGPGGHSYGSFGLANPHNALGRAIHYFSTTADEYTRHGIKTTYNVGVIGGGTSVNSIPFESWMIVDMRSESPERLLGVNDLLQNAIQKALAEENSMKRMGEDLSVEITKVGDRPSGSIPETHPLVQRTAAAAAYLEAVPMLGMSSTNSNTPLSLGIPSVTIGGGGKGGNAHALDEWWLNVKGYLAIQNALLVLLSEAGIEK